MNRVFIIGNKVLTLNPCGHLRLDPYFTFANQCRDPKCSKKPA